MAEKQRSIVIKPVINTLSCFPVIKVQIVVAIAAKTKLIQLALNLSIGNL